MAEYASKTSVTAEKSRNEIERTLVRFGADSFLYGWQGDTALIQFRANDKVVKFLLPLPDKGDPRFTLTPAGRRQRDPEATLKAWEQETRSSWRALAVVIKAKLVAVDAGIVTFEEEFLAHIVLPSGETIGDWVIPQIDRAYESMPRAIPQFTGGTE